MNYIVFDLEATCQQGSPKNFINETIEIGAVLFNKNFEYVACFDAFVKPKINPILTDFCKELTTITQKQVDDADWFPFVAEDFIRFIGDDDDYVLCSWGFYDKNQLIKDCILWGINFNWVNKHISLKHQFAEFKRIKPCGMNKALEISRMDATGTHHRGIDDAMNIAKIFKIYFDKWHFQIPS